MLIRRYFAWMIDALLIILLWGLLHSIFKTSFFNSNVFLGALWAIYGALSDASSRQGTIGKRYMGLIVMTEYGDRISLYRALIRNSFRVIPELMFIGVFWLLFSSGKQGLHDKFAATYVE
jgi:uncharacterized RDD family membrane protein YckC